jgi:uroporphyrinogen decarboxylase
MMRQAGRHIKEYRDLVLKHPTFRERSEVPELAVEISLQPYRNYNTDGCILFSDILTPLPGMGLDFDIRENVGPVMKKVDSWDAVNKMHLIDPSSSTKFVEKSLQMLRNEVTPETAVLGFVGCPYTLATYLIEGGKTASYSNVKRMISEDPKLLHTILKNLAESIAEYAVFQIQAGAQLIQLFDSWAGDLSPVDYDIFAAPYQKIIINRIKQDFPTVPTVMYIKHSGALLERMAGTGVDVVSLDWTVDVTEARVRLDAGRKGAGLLGRTGIQGNLDPALLFADHKTIEERTIEIIKKGEGDRHVMNLGHGIEANTPEENAKCFVDVCRNYRY